MDADQLRLILLLAGMALVVAIYLWDRYKRSRSRLKGLSLRQARRLQRELADQEPVVDDAIISFRAVKKEQESHQDDPPDEAPAAQESFFPESPEEDTELELPNIEMDAPHSRPNDPEPAAVTFSAAGDDDYLHASPEVQDKLPQMLVQSALYIGILRTRLRQVRQLTVRSVILL